MSTPDQALSAHREMLADVGEDVVIRRYTGSGTPRPKVEATTRARVTGFSPQELVGSIVQGDRKVIALADDLSALLPIVKGDKVVIRGAETTVIAADDNTRRVGGILVAIELTVRG